MGKVSSETPILAMSDIFKRFDSLEILKGIDLDLNSGDSVAILGPSGAGKSTLLHIAGLMDQPTSGKVILNGQDTSSLSENQRSLERLNTIGFLFQFHYLLPDFNILENVLMPCRLAGDDLRSSEREARHLLDRLGLNGRITHKPYELSGGEQQRAALARALVRRPRILLCDEPTGNLDQGTAMEVANLIWSKLEEEGVSSLVVTHNRDVAKQAKKTFTLKEGLFE